VKLHAGHLDLELAPELGGSILAFRSGSDDILRAAPAGASDVLETACFPLVPYANRIRDGRFGFGGRTASLERNLPGQPHPLHGDGWRGAWRVEAQDAASAILTFDAKGSRWPWSYAARQTARLTPSSLILELEVTNLDTEPGPFGIGFHPYFPRSSEARITASTTGAWMVDAELLPTSWEQGAAIADWSVGASVRGSRLVDHCHTGWAGEARIDYGPSRPSLRVTASPELSFLHIYAPPQEDFFCVEPVSHVPNALNSTEPEAQGVRILRPGQSLLGWMRLDIEP
jgi:aldose 1-epimerase